jgi:hypothetical protein
VKRLEYSRLNGIATESAIIRQPLSNLRTKGGTGQHARCLTTLRRPGPGPSPTQATQYANTTLSHHVRLYGNPKKASRCFLWQWLPRGFLAEGFFGARIFPFSLALSLKSASFKNDV